MKLRVAAAILIFYSTVMIQRAMPDLPERIPVRFDIHGHPASASRPETLWLFLAAQALIAGLFFAMPYFSRRSPHLVSLGSKRLSDFAPKLRDQIQLFIEEACGWMAVGFALFLTILIRQIIRAAMDPRQGPSMWLIPLFLVVVVAALGYYSWKYIELVKNAAPPAPSGKMAGTSPQLHRNPIVKK